MGDLDAIKINPIEFTKSGFYTPETLPPDCYLKGIMSDKVDIWSFGVLLFKLFTGEYPFGHRNDFSYEEIMSFASNADYRHFTLKDISELYRTLISYCLTSDHTLRPSAEE